MSGTMHDAKQMGQLRQTIPGLLRTSLAVPENTVALGAMLWSSLESDLHRAPQFVAYLPAGHIVDVPITPEAVDNAQSVADGLVRLAAQSDPRAVEGTKKARLAVYAPLNGGPDWVDLWFGDAVTPWSFPNEREQWAS